VSFGCEYGDAVFSDCDPSAICFGGTWSIAAPAYAPDSGRCEQLGCPPTFAAARASNPTCGSLTCFYNEGTCACWADAGTVWECIGPDSDGGCPVERPRLGSPCSRPSFVCDYGGPLVQCTCGMWSPLTVEPHP
jgi:hypothetical protein